MKDRWQFWLGLAIFIAYLVSVGLIHLDGHKAARQGDTPLLTDFTSFYAASLLAQRQPAVDLYRPREMYRASLDAAQAAYAGNLSENQARAIGFHPWMYPPPYIFVALPFAYLPYLAAWLAWLVATALIYLLAMRSILRDRGFWLIALAMPPVFFNIMYGQSGFLVAGLIGLGLAWLGPRPVLAGICLGLASVKPHFGLLVPLALICGAHWKSFWSAVATVGVIGLAAALAFGIDIWYAFLGTLMANLRGFDQGVYKWSVMPSIFGALHQLGLDTGWAWRGQMVTALMAAAVVVWTWWQRADRARQPRLEAAILCLATLLALPMVYLYDLMLLVPAVGWLWGDMRDRPPRRWEVVLMATSCVAMIGLWEMDRFGPVVGCLSVCALLGLALRRLVNARQSEHHHMA